MINYTNDTNKRKGQSLDVVLSKCQARWLIKSTGNKTYFLHTIGHDYDHGHGLKFIFPICNIFICYCCKRKNIYYMHRQHIIDPFNDM